MLLSYLGWSSQDDYFEMLNFAFDTYSMELADLMLDKMYNENVDVS